MTTQGSLQLARWSEIEDPLGFGREVIPRALVHTQPVASGAPSHASHILVWAVRDEYFSSPFAVVALEPNLFEFVGIHVEHHAIVADFGSIFPVIDILPVFRIEKASRLFFIERLAASGAFLHARHATGPRDRLTGHRLSAVPRVCQALGGVSASSERQVPRDARPRESGRATGVPDRAGNHGEHRGSNGRADGRQRTSAAGQARNEP